jgi:hypothetical protein
MIALLFAGVGVSRLEGAFVEENRGHQKAKPEGLMISPSG